MPCYAMNDQICTVQKALEQKGSDESCDGQFVDEEMFCADP